MPEQKQIIMVTGVQAAGKTTIANALAKEFPRSACVHADELQCMIASGRVWPPGPEPPTGEAALQLDLRLHNMCLLARSFSDAGFTVIMDDFIAGKRWEQLQQEMQGYPFRLVVLNPSIDAVIQRDRTRNERTIGDDAAHYLHHELETTMRDNGIWIDTTHQSVGETVGEIMTKLVVSGK